MEFIRRCDLEFGYALISKYWWRKDFTDKVGTLLMRLVQYSPLKEQIELVHDLTF